MQKQSRVAMAAAVLAMTSGAAAGQGSVVLYGSVDLGVELSRITGRANGDDVSLTRVNSNSTRFGLRGIEPLGAGLAAIFQIETGLSADTGGGTLASRDTFLGLQSTSWGTVKMGLNSNPWRIVGGTYELAPGGTTDTFFANLGGKVVGRSTTLENRMPNSVYWQSPKFSGFTVKGIVGADEARAAASATRPEVNNWSFGTGVDYATGPLSFMYAYALHLDPNVTAFGVGTAGDDSRVTGHRAAVMYRPAAGLGLGAIYDRQELAGIAGVGAPRLDVRRDAIGVQAQYIAGAHRFAGEFMTARNLKGSVCSTTSCDDTKAYSWSIADYYSLSKRTTLELYFVTIRNSARASYDYFVAPTNMITPGADVWSVSFDIRHDF